MNRKLLIIFITIFLLLILGLGIYLIFGFSQEEAKNGLGNAVPSGMKKIDESREKGIKNSLGKKEESENFFPPAKKSERVKVVSNNPSLGLAFAGKGKIVYFDKIQGRFIRQDIERGLAEPISQASFTSSSVQRVIWAPNKKSAILQFNNGDKFYIDLKTGKSTKLHQLIAGISWSPDSQKIVYEFQNEENNAKLTIADPDGSNPKVIKELGYTSRLLGWSPLPGGPISILQVYSIGEGRNVYPVYQDGSTGKVIKLAGFGSQAKYSRDGTRILYSVLDTDKLQQTLWVVDYNGLNQYSLGVQTFVEKCVWDAQGINIYCAVPTEELGSEPDLKDDTIDSIWKINTKTGEKKEVFDQGSAEIKLDAENLWLAQDEKSIFLENRKDDKIYEVKI